MTENSHLNFPPLSSFKKFSLRCALSICYCFFKLWRAVKKVVDFPNSTLNYKITPPLTKRINIKHETYLHSILVGNICAKSVPRKVSPRYSVVEKSTFTIHDIDSWVSNIVQVKQNFPVWKNTTNDLQLNFESTIFWWLIDRFDTCPWNKDFLSCHYKLQCHGHILIFLL